MSMSVVILAGGLGTRLAEETSLRPKPMVEIGGRPILWHLMKIYEHHGLKDFIVACGYKGEVIKEYFHNFNIHFSDYRINLRDGAQETLNPCNTDWRVSLIDTGMHTLTGGRMARLKPYLNSTFMMTYGDGLANVDITKLLAFHKSHGKIATVTAVHPPARFGELILDNNSVKEFSEKPQTGTGWINGGFFVFEPRVLDYIKSGDDSVLEREVLVNLAKDKQLMAFSHPGYWQPMDTLREKQMLETLWDSGKAPWKVWRD